MSTTRRVAGAGLLATALVLGSVAPAAAAIHEIVASFCSGGNGNLDPGGQTRFGERSFLRALQASGLYDIQFGVAPPGETPPAGQIPVTVTIDYERPNSKFSAAGGWFVFDEGPFTAYVSAGYPDHPAFEHCPAMTG